MDGVITCEEAYWDAAGLTVREILESSAYLGLNPAQYSPIVNLFYQNLSRMGRDEWRKYLPGELISFCKSRGINSNWDLAYIALAIHLSPLLGPILEHLLMAGGIWHGPRNFPFATQQGGQQATEEPQVQNNEPDPQLQEALSPIWERLIDAIRQEDWQAVLQLGDFHLWGDFLRAHHQSAIPVQNVRSLFEDGIGSGVRGLALLEAMNVFISPAAEGQKPWFSRQSTLWHEVRDLFQQWYLGADLYTERYGAMPAYGPKPGLIHQEEPLLGREQTHASLKALQEAGYTLAIATGRPRLEILTPMQRWNMLGYFDEQRIVTHDEAETAEQCLQQKHPGLSLSKPHPYVFLRAAYPEQSDEELLERLDDRQHTFDEVLVVGDAQADIWAAHEMNCPSVGVLSGVLGQTEPRLLEEANPTLMVNNFEQFARLMANHPVSA